MVCTVPWDPQLRPGPAAADSRKKGLTYSLEGGSPLMPVLQTWNHRKGNATFPPSSPTFPHPPPSLKPQLALASSPIAEDLLRAGPEQSDTHAVRSN